MEQDCSKCTALHAACANVASIGVVSKLLDAGGRDLLMEKRYDGYTALHAAVCAFNPSIETISKLIAVGGREILLQKNNDGFCALFASCFRCFTNFDCFQCFHEVNAFIFLAKEYISTQIGGEFAIGGLFNTASEDTQNRIYRQWTHFSPSLEIVISGLQSPTPILQAAIIAKAPKHIIEDIIHRFDCIHTRDSFGRYPINVAAEEGLRWNMGMRELVESNIENVANGTDYRTGLRMFMLAAMGDKNDLNTIYGTMKMSPHLARYDEY